MIRKLRNQHSARAAQSAGENGANQAATPIGEHEKADGAPSAWPLQVGSY
jgi:hypothetical protein